MNDFLTWQALVAFVLGVLMSAMVKGLVTRARSAI